MTNKIMMFLKILLLCVLTIIVFNSTVYASEPGYAQDIERAIQVIQEMSEQPDAKQMGMLIEKAKGFAIFPNMIKGGLGIGGQYGRGFLLRKDKDGKWYGPAFLELRGISYGWQLGIQSTALVLVVTNQRGLENFIDGNFKLGGDASLAIGPLGRRAELGTDHRFEASVYSYSMTKGAFAGISVEGAQLTHNKSHNQEYWEKDKEINEIMDTLADKSIILPLVNAIDQFYQN